MVCLYRGRILSSSIEVRSKNRSSVAAEFHREFPVLRSMGTEVTRTAPNEESRSEWCGKRPEVVNSEPWSEAVEWLPVAPIRSDQQNWSLNVLIAAVNHAGKAVEAK